MTIDEIIERLFSEKFNNSNDMDKIIDFVRSKEDKLTLRKRGIEIEEVLAYTKEQKEPNLEVKCNNDEVYYPYDFKIFKEEISKNISPNLKEISLPISFIRDNISFLSKLSSLTKLTINNYGFLSPEELNFISKNTNIKEIDIGTSYIQKDNYSDLVTVKKDGKLNGYYKDILIKQTYEPKIDGLSGIESNKDIKVDGTTITPSDLEKIFNIIGEDLTKTNRKIEINGKDQSYVFSIKDGIVNMDISDPNMNIASDLSKFFEKRGIKTNGVFVKVTKGYAETNFDALDKLSENVEVRVRYDSATSSSYEEFRALSETMKWYRQIINDYPLSPVEKLAFAYDILKTLEYNETETEDKMESREPHKIVKTGHIVCAGYTAMLEEIFKEFEPNIKIGSFGVTCYDDDNETLRGYHSRAIAIIDDEKYGIHGAYALDPTWDSYKSNGREKLDSEYTALDLYKYFMIPFSEYRKVFEHDSDIKFFQGNLSYLNTNLSDENIDKAITTIDRQKEQKKGELSFTRKEPLINYEIKEVLPNKSEQEIIELFKSKRIPNTTMMQIIRNVRLAEGYTNEIDEEMSKVSRIYDKLTPEVDQLTGKVL